MLNEQMKYGSDYKYLPVTSILSDSGIEVLPDLYNYTIQIANIQMIGAQDAGEFVLIDAGMPKSADAIFTAVEERFGEDGCPKAIILTHGHFDHVGAIIELVKYWDVPLYAHELELPYLTGKESYPTPDASVEGGLVAKMSPSFPVEPIHLGSRVQALPTDGTVPHLAGFTWIHTPGHAPGHVSFFRESDRALIAGDAFVTVKQDSLYKVLTQDQEMNGPPRYLTTDWEAAKQSVKKLAELKPAVAVTGHGLPMTGELLTRSLEKLAFDFDDMAKPGYGKYVN